HSHFIPPRAPKEMAKRVSFAARDRAYIYLVCPSSPSLLPGRGLLNPVEVVLRAQDQAAVRRCRRGHGHLAEAVLAEDLELGAGGNDERVAVLAQAKDLAVVRPRRRGERRAGAESLAVVTLPTGAGVVTGQRAAVVQHVE